MGKIFHFLGLTVGVNLPHMEPEKKRAAYAADITYGTNNEFGFDYLRDNMALAKEDRYQRGLHYAIVDEVDSILIDEARTPLIISGPADESQELYHQVDAIVPQLTRQKQEDGEGDFWVTEYVLSYDGAPSYTVSIMEFRDGKVARETQYFADPFKPGPSRAHLVESHD